jgi:hypothetical protein
MDIKHGNGLTPYYNTVINSTFGMCDFLGNLNGSGTNPVAKMVLDAVADTVPPGIFHPCPYFGEFKVINVSLKTTDVFLQFLKGSYRTVSRWLNDDDENIISFKMNLDVI